MLVRSMKLSLSKIMVRTEAFQPFYKYRDCVWYPAEGMVNPSHYQMLGLSKIGLLQNYTRTKDSCTAIIYSCS